MDVETLRNQGDGAYGFVFVFDSPQKRVFRTVVKQNGETHDASVKRRVAIAPSSPSGTRLIPDIGPRKLGDCSPSEEPCFKIVEAEGRRLLKFPVITANVGQGPLVVNGYRSSSRSTKWIATQTMSYTSGDTRSQTIPNVVFYHARDGHNHWHIRDFDSYRLHDERGSRIGISEKHGYCLQDNTTYRDWKDRPKAYPEVPQRPVYGYSVACGQGRHYTTSIVHGMSVGWGDTYPTTLPDQGIDITGLADGVYTVKVKVDVQGFVEESDETNNTATVKVRITGDEVTVDKKTATGL